MSLQYIAVFKHVFTPHLYHKVQARHEVHAAGHEDHDEPVID